MNGARLEQLTGIRSDHANNTIRQLETKNVIITRTGHYGKWMAINFDLDHWGAVHHGQHNPDPRCLLSQDYQSNPIDNGLDLLSLMSEDKIEPPKAADEKTIEKTIKKEQETAEVLIPESGDTININIQTKNTDKNKDTDKNELLPDFQYPEAAPKKLHKK
jgi:hypothetical protein